jgi:hypothetical protein
MSCLRSACSDLEDLARETVPAPAYLFHDLCATFRGPTFAFCLRSASARPFRIMAAALKKMMLRIAMNASPAIGFDGSTVRMPKINDSQKKNKASLIPCTIRRWYFVAVPSTSDSSLMNADRLKKILFFARPVPATATSPPFRCDHFRTAASARLQHFLLIHFAATNDGDH